MQKIVKNIIAIIPARGGSKRIPNKNIKLFFGMPILGRTILKLKKTKLFKDIYVSTDSKKIAKIAKKYGAKVPYYRSKKLSDNFTSTQKVIQDMINFLNKKTINSSYVCCVYPTAFNINSNDIHNNYWKLIKWGAKEYYLECSTNNVYMEDYDNFIKMGVWSEGMII